MKKHKGNWFGAKTDIEISQLKKQLEIAYKVSHPDPLCVQDFNGMTVAQALRLRMLPPELVAEEFDEVLRKKTIGEVQKVEKSILENEIEKIRNMNDTERKEFSHKLLFKEGCYPHSSGVLKKFRTGCDKNVFGFAIDSLSFKFKKSNDFGKYYVVDQELIAEIFIYDSANYHSIKNRIISGLIFTDIEDFESSILRLGLMFKDSNVVDTVVHFLKKQKKYIIIDDDYNIL